MVYWESGVIVVDEKVLRQVSSGWLERRSHSVLHLREIWLSVPRVKWSMIASLTNHVETRATL